MESMVRRFLCVVLLIGLSAILSDGDAEACPACWTGYGPGAERFNKGLAELRELPQAQAPTRYH